MEICRFIPQLWREKSYYLCSMENKIEFKVRLNIAIIFLLVVSSVAAMSWYLHKLHQEIALSRNDMEQQQIHIAAINELFLSVNHVQSLSTIYLSTLTHRNLKNYLSQVDSVSILLDSMILMPASEQNKLITIKELLFQQKQNIKRLNNQYVKDNPVKIITQMLKEYEKELVEEVSVINIHTDTLFNTAPKKNFFKRLGEVFKPSKDSLQVITTQRYDTVTIAKVESLPIISEVKIRVNTATDTE